MNLDQLNAATQQLMGGLEWSEVRNGSPVNLFEALSETLGKPDFIESTEEDLTPSSLFLKFLSDAAGELCLAGLDADLEGDGEPRLLILASAEDSLACGLPSAYSYGNNISFNNSELESLSLLCGPESERVVVDSVTFDGGTEDPLVYYNMGLLLFEAGRHEESAAMLDLGLSLAPDEEWRVNFVRAKTVLRSHRP